jgi:hypothetical protein
VNDVLFLVDTVIFMLKTQLAAPPQAVVVPWVDANEIHGRAVERNLGARELRGNLERTRKPGSDHVINVSEAMRLELLLILDAVQADDKFSEALGELRKAASSPIIG